mgnify:CR=1 FL=1|tara:strand:- start:449 stop:697 length:249 start_codon:yes stop_codon:yes gene_type:complete
MGLINLKIPLLSPIKVSNKNIEITGARKCSPGKLYQNEQRILEETLNTKILENLCFRNLVKQRLKIKLKKMYINQYKIMKNR